MLAGFFVALTFFFAALLGAFLVAGAAVLLVFAVLDDVFEAAAVVDDVVEAALAAVPLDDLGFAALLLDFDDPLAAAFFFGAADFFFGLLALAADFGLAAALDFGLAGLAKIIKKTNI